MSVTRILFSLLLLVAWAFGSRLMEQWAIPTSSADLAVQQIEEDGSRETLRIQEDAQNLFDLTWTVIFVALLLLVWRKHIVKGMFMFKKSVLFLLLPLLVLLTVSGCVKKPKVEKFAEVQNHQTAFVIQLEGDSQAKLNSHEQLEKMRVSAKRINIPQRFKKTGRWGWQGEWIPTVKVIAVDRRPVTREWIADSGKGTSEKDEGIWIESKDSIAFSTGFNCTAMVKEENSALFLYNHPSGSLAHVMDNQIRNDVQSLASEVAARYKMDECRERKLEIITEVRETVIPKYEKLGVTISTIGMFGGYTYVDKEIQEAINATFVAQQEKVTAAAQFDAQDEKNSRIKLEAEGVAAAEITKARGVARSIEIKAAADANSIRAVASAAQEAANNPVFLELKRLEIEQKRLSVWDGKYPQWYMGGSGKDLGLIIQPPATATRKD